MNSNGRALLAALVGLMAVLSQTSRAHGQDCNTNGFLDSQDISEGRSQDCNSNLVPDECESTDCNTNGTSDACEIAANPSLDCNTNAVLDRCEILLPNRSLLFDGSNDVCRIPQSAVLEPRNELTIECWVRPNTGSAFHTHLIRKTADGGPGYILAWQHGGGARVNFRIDNAVGGSMVLFDPDNHNAYIGQWTHLAAAYSVSGNFARLYVNGVLKAAGTAIGQLNYTSADLHLCGSPGGSWPLNGRMDEVRIWNVARTHAQIQSSMSVALLGTETGLVGYWRLNEGAGQVINDSSVNDLDGVLGRNEDVEGSDPAWSTDAAPLAPLAADCNANGRPDVCDLPGHDCNTNQRPDDCDLANRDCNTNATPDECESLPDCNSNNLPDLCETYTDCNSNGTRDACEALPDCNTNNQADLCESLSDCNSNTTPDVCEAPADCNTNGQFDACDIAANPSLDCNTNAILDRCEILLPNRSLLFDGSNDSCRIPRSAVLEPRSELTIECWVQAQSGSATHTHLIRKAGDFAPGYILAWQHGGNGRVNLRIDNAVGGTLVLTDPDHHNAYIGQWTHLAAVYSVSGNYSRLFVNGVLKASGGTVGLINYTPVDLHLCGYPNGGLPLSGRMDEVRIWNVARTQAQIQSSRSVALSGTETGLVGYWRLDEGAGQNISDSAPNNLDGVLGRNSTAEGDDPAWSTIAAPLAPLADDCNLNGRPDTCDAVGNDCNTNGRPDDCEQANHDCNTNVTLDECELLPDCNSNQLPDLCETYSDCNTNGTRDACEFLPDCNTNNQPDLCDALPDCNSNQVPDVCESTTDCNTNGVQDVCELAAGAPDCNSNATIDVCDIATGAPDANHDLVPDSCQPDVRVMPVITLINPANTTAVRGALPTSQEAVVRGATFYVEIWSSDVGSVNTGLTGVYVDMAFCTQITAHALFHGNIFTTFTSGSISPGLVDEFGGSALPSGGGSEPEWVRIGWVRCTATVEVSACSFVLSPSESGIAAFGRGDIPWSLVSLGGADLTVLTPARSYDLTGNGFINVGDLSLFATSWLDPAPPAPPAHDFDCDNFVGVSDLSWFATGWLRFVTDPAIVYPPCDGGPPAPFGDEGSGAPPDIAVRVVPRLLPSASDTTTTLPVAVSEVDVGDVYYVEMWISDVNEVNTGLTSAYLDVAFESTAATVQAISHGGIFTLFATGQASSGLIDELGGSALPGGVGNQPQWVRVAYAQVSATAGTLAAIYELRPSTTGIAALGRGQIDWARIELDSSNIAHRPRPDIDGDGDIDTVDLHLFVRVLLGIDSDEGHAQRSDMNLDGQADGEDVDVFVARYIAG